MMTNCYDFCGVDNNKSGDQRLHTKNDTSHNDLFDVYLCKLAVTLEVLFFLTLFVVQLSVQLLQILIENHGTPTEKRYDYNICQNIIIHNNRQTKPSQNYYHSCVV